MAATNRTRHIGRMNSNGHPDSSAQAPLRRGRASWPLAVLAAVVGGMIPLACATPPESPGEPGSGADPGGGHGAHAAWIRSTGLDQTLAGRSWLEWSQRALTLPGDVPLPYHEEGVFGPEEGMALGYRIQLPVGQKLEVELRDQEGRAVPFFMDVFTLEDGADSAPLWSAAPRQTAGTFEPADSGTFVLRVQPEVLRGGRYQVTLKPRAILDFPVFGRTTSAILSFFGADRDGGRRSHHGVDIFAPRGTPVVAATAGRVRRVEVTNLGGKVVWLRDSERNQSLYYAHLHEQLVEEGAYVQPGDTLGLVGNTGNARTTPPHLHFGIYRRGRGPINPFPYLRQPASDPAPLEADPVRIGTRVAADREGLRMRSGPTLRTDAVAELPEATPVKVVAGAGEWYRVFTEDGTEGFVLARLVREVEPVQATGGVATSQAGGL